MILGEKLRQARQEAGLSQRQLCGDTITRNMLSQIENGSARPSMDTLKYLAGRLGKPVSYFLDEKAAVSPNAEYMLRARECYDREDFSAAMEALEEFRFPDDVFRREWELLSMLTALELARQALDRGRDRYARQLLEEAGEQYAQAAYRLPELEHRRILLLSRLPGEPPGELARRLPDPTQELMLRARAAMNREQPEEAGRYLDAVPDRTSPEWQLLRGQAYLALRAYTEAARCLHAAEAACPKETALPLERCYREMGDYRRAYEYACRTRSFLGG